ncbi:hypothetical protein K2173_013340 [Erythroxylum novogranatense]|uniref:Flap endonuclease GEN-like 1 n=1 Tax=Erythroxylum novogranatense TaxID=1862640 RepID=A0AAV8SA50_9ROSI|nr:hypothetical protein K2173_013340 [Erythroxylum novogranatense]
MGVGGKFWDLLKPCAKFEGPDFLREKRVAIDLSYWIVQHETAIKNNYFLKPHLRLTFLRTINIFSKFGAYPVFVVDGTPSPLKSQARILRFFRFSGFDVSSLPVVEEGVSAERNPAFLKCVQECVELLELFGMPVLRANGEAEALCAQLNREGHVDACITADSDAFLYGAQCVIKSIKPNTKEPFECYRMSDIETGLGLRRKQLIAISLLVGNDHDLNGVQGIGIDTALRVVRSFSEDDVLDGLREIGNRKALGSEGGSEIKNKFMITIHENLAESRLSHCSFCGHPGSKREHFQSACQYCVIDNEEGCLKKPERFKCNCDWCAKDRKVKEHRKYEKWKMKVCQKIAVEPNFPNEEIIEMYMCTCHGNFTADNGPWISWGGPNTDMIVDFLVFHRLWNPAYIRQRMLPMLSTIYLREMTSKPNKELLNGQYEFDCIQRVKVRYGHQYYVTRWKKATPSLSSGIIVNPVVESDGQLEDLVEIDESSTQFDGYDAPQIHIDGGLLLTDENIELIRSAFPQEVDRFSKDKELKESRKRKPSSLALEGSESKGVQLSITEFYRSTKVKSGAKQGEEQTSEFVNEDGRASKEKRDVSSPNLSKSVRRRLLL